MEKWVGIDSRPCRTNAREFRKKTHQFKFLAQDHAVQKKLWAPIFKRKPEHYLV